jgi:hypothetical protein
VSHALDPPGRGVTVQPASRNCFAVASPMPDEAPVTRATLVVMVVGPFEGM